MTIQCCKCRKIRGNRTWYHAYVFTNETVSFTYCPVCHEEVLADIDYEREGSNAAIPKMATVQPAL